MSATIGSDLQRIGALAKVTGSTRFGADDARPGLAYAMLVLATIGKGRIKTIDTTAAERTAGVLLVLTHESMDRLQPPGFVFGDGTGFQSIALMQTDRVFYRGQPIALVVAESLEAASEAAALVRAAYEEEPFSVTLDSPGAETVLQSKALPIPMFADKAVGDPDDALADGSLVVVEADYVGPPQHQNPMELLATVAEWNDGTLTVHESTQNAEGLRFGLSHQLGIDPANVRVVSLYAGGAFGQKNSLGSHTAFVAVAARRLARPVKLVMPRDQTFYDAAFRPASRQRVKLAADRHGRMVAAIHQTWQQTSRHDLFANLGTDVTSRFYAIPNFRSANHLVRTDVQTPGFMRAPWEHIAAFALESSVDELAYKLDVDPVQLRLTNDGRVDPMTGKPFSSRHVAECLNRGAALFGWSTRNPTPGSMRAAHGDLLGWGVALGCYPGNTVPAAAKVRFNRDGSVDVSVSGHEMGQGLRTAIALVVGERLGVAPANVQITVGDTNAPPQQLTAGAWGTASACPAAYDACNKLREELFVIATSQPNGALNGEQPSTMDVTVPGKITVSAGRSVAITDLLESAGRDFVEADTKRVAVGQPAQAFDRTTHGLLAVAGPEYPDFVTFSFAAHFIEVLIDPETYQVRVPRAVSVVDCGEVVSLRTARSQVLGGLVWGIGACLREASEVDPRFGGFLNSNIAEYHVPVNADIGEYIVDFIDEPDFKLNPIGAKGLGEVVMCGVAPAIANAIYHATGRRFRTLPIRLDDFHAPPCAE
jgi:xanthine dehydrogenase YagR molybdenum-binding subunit